jgi:hypothetical protein
MNAIWKRITEHPFVSMSAFAALVHSTWSIGTMFSGGQPVVTASAENAFGDWLRQTVELLMWLVPALAIALAIDVGLVESAHAVRSGRKNAWAFVLLALCSYFLQLIYIAAHFPDMQLSAYISDRVKGIAEFARDFAVVIVPALLQLPIVLYVLAGDKQVQDDAPKVHAPVMRHEHVLVREDALQIAEPPPPPLPSADPRSACRCSLPKRLRCRFRTLAPRTIRARSETPVSWQNACSSVWTSRPVPTGPVASMGDRQDNAPGHLPGVFHTPPSTVDKSQKFRYISPPAIPQE